MATASIIILVPILEVKSQQFKYLKIGQLQKKSIGAQLVSEDWLQDKESG